MRHSKLLPLAAALVTAAAGISVVRAAPAAPKGYLIAEITVTDAQAYTQYAAAVPAIAARFSGRYLVRAGQSVAIEGAAPAGRIVVIEFDSLAAAKAFEDSAEYQAIAPLRRKAAQSRVFLVEGTAAR